MHKQRHKGKDGRQDPDAAQADARKDVEQKGCVETETPDTAALFKTVVERANQGDREALTRLQRFLDQNPWIWERAGDLTAVAEQAWIELIAGSNQLMQESVKRQISRMRSDLAGEHPSAMEQLLVNQVISCFLAAQHGEIEAAGPAGSSLAQAAFKLKRAESSQKRLLNATKTLATLRALLPQGLVPANPLRLHAAEDVG